MPLNLLCLTRAESADDGAKKRYDQPPSLRDALIDALASMGDAVSLSFTDPASPDADLLAHADGVICGSLSEELRARMPKLRWVQFWSAGVDGKLFPAMWANDAVVTTGAGVHVAAASEHVLSMMLAFARGLPQSFAAQKERDWSARDRIAPSIFELDGKTVGIVGAGEIGQAIAKRCKAFGMRTVGTRRDVSRGADGFDILLPYIQYHELILESNFIVLALPLTPHTKWIFGEDEIEILHKGTYLFNIGRGGLLDEAWVYKALKNKWLAGAGLDVFTDEPLPSDSPFWDLDNVIITPHLGGATPSYWTRFAKLVAEQTQRLLSGESLRNTVRQDLGY